MDIIAELKALLEKYEKRDDNWTIQEFCDEENFSRSFFKTLQARGLAPKVKRMPGLALQRITKEARAEWHKLIDELEIAELKSPSPEVKAKQDRWIEQRREAGLRGGRPRKERRPPSVRRRKSSRERRNA
jgi:hypothetical protein